jgi:molybdate transport system ATP-binding protein
VLGPNGAGKSTLLSLILADNPKAYANDITIFGRKRGTGETIWEIKRPIGWMSPELQIHYKKLMTCLEVVCSGFFDSIGLYRSCSEPQVLTAKKWMTVLGITDLEAQFFPRISEGLQRLTLIARALVKSPNLLVLDEPCQGLDRNTRKNIIGLIDQVCRKTNATLLYVTHDMAKLPGVITHVLTLDSGRITGCGAYKKNRQNS